MKIMVFSYPVQEQSLLHVWNAQWIIIMFWEQWKQWGHNWQSWTQVSELALIPLQTWSTVLNETLWVNTFLCREQQRSPGVTRRPMTCGLGTSSNATWLQRPFNHAGLCEKLITHSLSGPLGHTVIDQLTESWGQQLCTPVTSIFTKLIKLF